MDAKPPAAGRTADEASIRYEGWRIVGACFLLASFGWALGFYGQSVYLAELQRIHGWPASVISGATTFFYLFGALLVAFFSEAMRTLGVRTCLIGGVVIMAAASALLGQVTQVWQLYPAYALLAVGWAGTSLGAVTNTLGLWFEKKRGMAISLALNGASFGGVVGAPLMVAAIGGFGFAIATAGAGAVMLLVMVPVILLTIGQPPRPPATPGTTAEMTGREIRTQALRDPAFLTLTTGFAVVLFAQVAFIVHLIAYLDAIIGRERAAAAMALMTAMAVVGRLSLSTVIDRLDQRLTAAVSSLSQSVALVIVINSRSEPLMFGACALFGFSVGNLITLPALIVQREFPPRSFNVLTNLVTAINQVTYAFGPGVVGLLHDATGGYAVPFYLCIGLQIAGACLILSQRRRWQGQQKNPGKAGVD